MTICKNFLTSSLDIYDKDNEQLQDELTELCNIKIINGKQYDTRRISKYV